MYGAFCVQQSTRSSSAVPMDQVLKQSCNKTAEVKGGVIGITTQKATVSKRNLIKHNKMQGIKVLHDFFSLSADDKFFLHDWFFDGVTAYDIKNVENITAVIKQRKNPYKTPYKNFIDEHFLRKSNKLFDLIQTTNRKTIPTKPLDIKKQTLKTLTYIDYICLKMYEIRELLIYKLAPVPF